jgi:hypothetical protein
VCGQSARKSRPRDLLLLSAIIKDGFGEAASVKIPGANEKDPVIHAQELNRKREKLKSGEKNLLTFAYFTECP